MGEKKTHNFAVSTILDSEDLLLDTFRYCEKVQDLGIRSIRDTIFSGLIRETAICFEKDQNIPWAVSNRSLELRKLVEGICHSILGEDGDVYQSE